MCRPASPIAIPALGLGEIGALSGGAVALALIAIAESSGRPARSRRSAATRSTPTRSSSRSAPRTGAPACCRASRSTRASRGAPWRWSGRAHAALGPVRRAAARGDDALPDAALRRAAAGHARGDHHRRRGRARRLRGFLWLWRIDQGDAQLAIVGFAAVTLLGVLPGIVVAVVASLLALDPARVPAADLRARPRPPRGERGRGLPVPQRRAPPGVRDHPGPRPLPLLERAVLRERVVLPRRGAALVDEADRPPARCSSTRRGHLRRHDRARDARGPDRSARAQGA